MTISAEPDQLNATELRRLLSQHDEVVLLDVRSPGEYAAVHIEGSVNLPLDLIEQRSTEIAARLTGPAVLLCAQGTRARRGAQLLAAAGAADLRVLDGGVGDWESAGGAVRRGRGHWAMDRQVRLVAGSVVLTAVLASIGKPAAKWVAAGMGAGLTYSALSNTCAMARVLGYLPYNRSAPAFDVDAALAGLPRTVS
jgi:rhodanese-related sulfurtransferase